MRVLKRRSIYTLCAIMVLFFIGSAFGFEPMLPDGLVIEDIFKPGFGAPVGKVQLVQGEVVIMHADMPSGYLAQEDLPLFKGDTIITLEKGRIRFELNDESVLTLASRTKLVINRSVYDPTKKSRSSFLGMSLGKARFWVVKLMDFTRSEFRVKTRTAVMGVRGSDFIITATASSTEVTALEDTRLEIVSLSAPEVKPTLLTDFERVVVEEGGFPSEVEKLSPEEIELVEKEFEDTPERVEPEPAVGGLTGAGQEGVSEENVGKEGMGSEAALGQGEVVENPPIFVPGDELVKPEDLGEPKEFEETPAPHILEGEEVSGPQEEVMEQQEEIFEEQQEETIKQETQELPPFPVTPQ